MRICINETGIGKLFCTNIAADPNEMIARGTYILSQFRPLSETCAFLVDGCVAHTNVQKHQTQLGYTAFARTKTPRVIGASGIHASTMSFGKVSAVRFKFKLVRASRNHRQRALVAADTTSAT